MNYLSHLCSCTISVTWELLLFLIYKIPKCHWTPWEYPLKIGKICSWRFCWKTPFQTCPQSGQKDGAKTAQNIVYKTSTAAKIRACAEVEHLAMEVVFSYRFFQKSLAFQAGQWAAVSGQKDEAKTAQNIVTLLTSLLLYFEHTWNRNPWEYPRSKTRQSFLREI